MLKLYDALYARYGDLRWWPAKTPYEVIVGAVLTQNTAWGNVEKAIANFSGCLTPELVEKIAIPELIDIIKPAGFFNQKAQYLKAVTAWFAGYGYDESAVLREPFDKTRAGLLSVRGVGQETADSILLYAVGFPTFVADAYTARLCERFPAGAGKSYNEIKAYFENNLPKDIGIYKNFHALIVINGKDHCRKTKPVCSACPLNKLCMQIIV